MLAEYKKMNLGHFEFYNVLPLRSRAHIVDASLPIPSPANDYADGSWTDWLDTNELKESPYFTKVIDTFKKHTKVILIRLLRLAPNSVIDEHTDPTLGLEIEKYVIRLTIPLVNTDEVFYLNSEPVLVKPGEYWYL